MRLHSCILHLPEGGTYALHICILYLFIYLQMHIHVYICTYDLQITVSGIDCPLDVPSSHVPPCTVHRTTSCWGIRFTAFATWRSPR